MQRRIHELILSAVGGKPERFSLGDIEIVSSFPEATDNQKSYLIVNRYGLGGVVVKGEIVYATTTLRFHNEGTVPNPSVEGGFGTESYCANAHTITLEDVDPKTGNYYLAEPLNYLTGGDGTGVITISSEVKDHLPVIAYYSAPVGVFLKAKRLDISGAINKKGVYSFREAFENANISQIIVTQYDVNRRYVAPITMKGAFTNAHITTLPQGIDYSLARDMSNAFRGCIFLTGSPEVFYAQNLSMCFYGCTSLRLKNFTLNGAETSSFMFYGCNMLGSSLITGTINSPYQGTVMNYMFYECYRLSTIKLQGSVVAAGTFQMFANCAMLFEVWLPDWVLLEAMSMAKMFYNCPVLSRLHLCNWNFPPGMTDIDTQDTFFNCTKLTIIEGPVTGISTNLDFSYSPLTYDSAMVIINGLSTVDESLGKKITFKSSTFDLLTEDDIALATSKGWSIIKA